MTTIRVLFNQRFIHNSVRIECQLIIVLTYKKISNIFSSDVYIFAFLIILYTHLKYFYLLAFVYFYHNSFVETLICLLFYHFHSISVIYFTLFYSKIYKGFGWIALLNSIICCIVFLWSFKI